jgi:penicillin-binding protein 1A
LAKSKNLVSIRLVQSMGVSHAKQWVSRFGFDTDKHPDNLTLALGAGSVTPLQMAAGYSIFANGGFRVDPVVIERIVGSNGKVLFQAPPAPPLSEELRVVPARNVFIVDSLLQEVTRSGTAARAQGTLKRPDLFGKTGTTNDAVDAWFAGFQPGVAAVVWMGYDEPRSLGSRETGGGLSLPVWISYMERALRGVAVQSYVPPEDVVNVEGDWRYSEFAEGGMVRGVGVDVPDPSASAASATSDAAPAAASAAPPANGAASGLLSTLLSSF